MFQLSNIYFYIFQNYLFNQYWSECIEKIIKNDIDVECNNNAKNVVVLHIHCF